MDDKLLFIGSNLMLLVFVGFCAYFFLLLCLYFHCHNIIEICHRTFCPCHPFCYNSLAYFPSFSRSVARSLSILLYHISGATSKALLSILFACLKSISTLKQYTNVCCVRVVCVCVCVWTIQSDESTLV